MSIHRSSQPGLEQTMRIGSPGLVAHGSYSFAHPVNNSAIPIQYKQFSQKVKAFFGNLSFILYIWIPPVHIIFILLNLIKFSTSKVRNQLRPIHSRTLDAELTFQCTRPVTYQIQEVAGELFENEDFASHLWRLRVWFSNRFRPEIQKKPNLYK